MASTSTSSTFKIELQSHQTEHVAKILKTLERLPGIIDASTMGNGKTYTTSYVAYKLELPMLVICPSGICTMWEGMRSTFGANVLAAYSYERMRNGKSATKTSFPYLIKKKQVVEHKKSTETIVEYVVQDCLRELIRGGMLLVVDESHRAKDPTSMQTEAVTTLIQEIVRSFDNGGRSRYMMLSATPYDNEKFVAKAFRTLGYTTEKSLTTFNIQSGWHETKGIAEIASFCIRVNPTVARQIIANHKKIDRFMQVAEAGKLAYALFIGVVKPNVILAMPSPQIDRDVGVLYANMPAIEYERYRLAVMYLQDLLLFCEESGDIAKMDKAMIAKLSIALRDIEHTKVGIFAREAASVLGRSGTTKVVINFNFKTTIPMFLERLYTLMPDIDALVYNGDVSKDLREMYKESFQEPNSDFRLFVATIASGAEGISLHDLDGRFPRTTLMSPGYSILKLHQASGRILRSGTKSKGCVRMLYGKSASSNKIDVKEQRIIDALARKSNVMKSLLTQAELDGIKFPGEYTPIEQPIADVEPFTNMEHNVGINAIPDELIEHIIKKNIAYFPAAGTAKPEIIALSDQYADMVARALAESTVAAVNCEADELDEFAA